MRPSSVLFPGEGRELLKPVIYRNLNLLLRRLKFAADCAEQIFLCKAEGYAVAGAAAIDGNAADGDLGKQNIVYCTAKRFAVQLRQPHAAKRQFSFVRPCAYCYNRRSNIIGIIEGCGKMMDYL